MVLISFNLIMRPLGGVPIDKGNSKSGTSNVDVMANFFELKKKFVMAITPEGTRSKEKNGKVVSIMLPKKLMYLYV